MRTFSPARLARRCPIGLVRQPRLDAGIPIASGLRARISRSRSVGLRTLGEDQPIEDKGNARRSRAEPASRAGTRLPMAASALDAPRGGTSMKNKLITLSLLVLIGGAAAGMYYRISAIVAV